MTREDHSPVSNQMYANYAVGKGVEAMKVVALSSEDRLYLEFKEKFENKFILQRPYQKNTIFESWDLAWELLRIFNRESLKKVSKKILDKYYPRDNSML